MWILSGALGGCASWQPAAPSLSGQTIVVTGASSGLGQGVALALARRQANVVLAARRADVLEGVARAVQASGGQALVVPTDVSRPDDVTALAEAARGRFGRIDVWINNAGVAAIGRFDEIPVDDHLRLLDVNLKGVVLGSHAALRVFKQQRRGTLVNLGSVESEVPLAYQASYVASKAGVLNLGRALNEELRLAAFADVHVVTVMPWAVDTPLFDHAANHSGHTLRMIALDDPAVVVEAIVGAVDDPQEEVTPGWKAPLVTVMHRWFPDAVERFAADLYHRAQMEKAPPAPSTSGSLHEPLREGRGVEGRVRARMAAEDAAPMPGERTR